MADNSLEILADQSVNAMNQFISSEDRFVTDEHDLMDKLLIWDNIFVHLCNIVPDSVMPNALDLFLTHIADNLMKIRELLESEALIELKIEREEKDYLEHFTQDFKHHKWKAVKKDVNAELSDEKKVIRLQDSELLALHKGFKSLREFMDASILNKLFVGINLSNKQKEDFELKYEHYFIEIYKFVKTYEDIFKDLIEKEKYLRARLKEKSIDLPTPEPSNIINEFLMSF